MPEELGSSEDRGRTEEEVGGGGACRPGTTRKEPEPPKSYADKVKQHLPERTKTIVVKQPSTPNYRQQQIFILYSPISLT